MSLFSVIRYGSHKSHFTASKYLFIHVSTYNRLQFYSQISNSVKSQVQLTKINVKPDKDKLLFYYENARFFNILNGCALVNFIFWIQMSEFTYKYMKDVETSIQPEQVPWWRKINFKDKTTRTVVASVCFFIGYGILATSWLYTLRSVRMLVLRKGGEAVSIVTYAPLGGKRTLDISLDKISTTLSRHSARVQLPMKVQGKWFYYILDTQKGIFHNPHLFDYTAGMNRKLK